MKAFFRYRLLDNLKSLAVLIAVLIAVPLLLSITLAGSASTMNGTGSLVGSIWALVIGIVVLRGDLRLGNQFGLSRRSAFWGSVLSCTAAFAAASAVLSLLTAVLQMIYRGSNGRIAVMDIYQFVYGDSTVGVMPAWDYVRMACMLFALCLCFGFFGMLCTMAFWRLNKLGKWILGVSMGLLLGVGLPNLAYRLSPWLLRPARVLASNVWALIVFLLVWAAVFLLGAWLLARRASIKPAAK
ncbi:hypothetical protein SDC9_69646 [bioreactor metagenome]|uniref:Uncharacterized protein n=1 Tax=bioreactor metagenome TaxID=1076179 RepID=A0A644Y3P4_9ZZZZ